LANEWTCSQLLAYCFFAATFAFVSTFFLDDVAFFLLAAGALATVFFLEAAGAVLLLTVAFFADGAFFLDAVVFPVAGCDYFIKIEFVSKRYR
jgi:hypothetical protein